MNCQWEISHKQTSGQRRVSIGVVVERKFFPNHRSENPPLPGAVPDQIDVIPGNPKSTRRAGSKPVDALGTKGFRTKGSHQIAKALQSNSECLTQHSCGIYSRGV